MRTSFAVCAVIALVALNVRAAIAQENEGARSAYRGTEKPGLAASEQPDMDGKVRLRVVPSSIAAGNGFRTRENSWACGGRRDRS